MNNIQSTPLTIDHIDNINRYLAQAKSIVNLISADGERKSGFVSSHEDIGNAIWAVNDLLTRIDREINNNL
ncbi:hypothetical protein [Rodentibacter haemolyticus]|uniref:Uncharacterized protein n=1 Tax=Rodentibacter haemolyticus TaxID=2778911 RepID=A0ABX6UVS0_9PAST|nr:hypothetical protein [Rodentibacter haemolyticus]QPB42175.1 hypothetical protein IHV77_09700 [Rodentibacter haemolyticus]